VKKNQISKDLGEELADVVFCRLLVLAKTKTGIDLQKKLLMKISFKNQTRIMISSKT